MNYVNINLRKTVNYYSKLLDKIGKKDSNLTNNIVDNINEIDQDAIEYAKIRIKIAKMTTPILIKRCREILRKFLDDKIKNGTMPLPR